MINFCRKTEAAEVDLRIRNQNQLNEQPSRGLSQEPEEEHEAGPSKPPDGEEHFV